MARLTGKRCLVTGAGRNLAEKQDAVLPLDYPGRNARFFDYDEDLDKAKQLLKSAGFADGFSTTLSYNAGDPVQEPIALIYQTSLRRAGINVSLDKLPAGVFYENVTKRQKPAIFYLDSPGPRTPATPPRSTSTIRATSITAITAIRRSMT